MAVDDHDQVLGFHRVSKRVYDLTGLRTGSVRDQLVRSYLLVLALVEESLISSGQKLLVFGGGAAGINAALAAAELGVSVDLIELKAKPFTTLRTASWRRIDPFEYDWPHDHFNDKLFPKNVPSFPLKQPGGSGAKLAQHWTKQLHHWMSHLNGKAGRGTVTLMTSTDAYQFVPISDNITSHIEVTGPWANGRVTTRRYGAVISSIGAASETTSDTSPYSNWNRYHGPKFWTDDDHIPPGHSSFAVGTVVISGGGDGGMQDFQRAATGWFGKELFHRLQALARTIDPEIELAPDWLRAAVFAAEDRGRRAYVWQHNKAGVPKDTERWHASFKDAVEKLFAQIEAKHNKDVFHALLQIFRPELSGVTSVAWLYKSSTPGYSYALNRYLVIFLELLKKEGNIQLEVLPLGAIQSIWPTSHHVCSTPQGCRGKPHMVEIAVGKRGHPLLTSGYIIIRHGAKQHPFLAPKTEIAREQMTPFDFPQ